MLAIGTKIKVTSNGRETIMEYTGVGAGVAVPNTVHDLTLIPFHALWIGEPWECNGFMYDSIELVE